MHLYKIIEVMMMHLAMLVKINVPLAIFEMYYRPPIAAINKAPILCCRNRISYTSGFKKCCYRLLYYDGF